MSVDGMVPCFWQFIPVLYFVARVLEKVISILPQATVNHGGKGKGFGQNNE
jgi:hypothetical protein